MSNNARLSDSLFAKYHAERAGGEILEHEHGFIAYRITGAECFIVDMFIEKEYRRTPLFKKLMSELENVAKSSGCTLITANIFLNDPGASNTLIAALKSGFKVSATGNGVLLISKDIGGETHGKCN